MLTAPTDSASCILQCYWILELRQVAFPINGTSFSVAPSSIDFTNRLIGNIGAPVRPLGSDTMGHLENEHAIYLDDPLSAIVVPETVHAGQPPLITRYRIYFLHHQNKHNDVEIFRNSADVDMRDLFEDEEYGTKLLGIVRRGTSDSSEYHVVPLVSEWE